MVVVLVLLTFAFFVALDHFVLSRRRLGEATIAPTRPELMTLSATQRPLPAGLFLQPTYTWSRLGASGEVYLGVHPMLLGLVGVPCEFDLRDPGEHLAKGQPLVRIGRAGRHLTVRSPLGGRVEQVNHRLTADALWRGVEEDGGSWLYRLQPERVAEEMGTWLAGEEAAEWTRRRYDDLRAFLHGTATAGVVGTVMADGGDLPAGILDEMGQGVWAGLEDRFLAPLATQTTQSDRPEREGRK
jgi:glycine cleavage system H lipoate-binding protein